jgi:hypothetical protein
MLIVSCANSGVKEEEGRGMRRKKTMKEVEKKLLKGEKMILIIFP